MCGIEWEMFLSELACAEQGGFPGSFA